MNTKPVGDKITLPNGQVAPFSKAYKAGELLFISGQLAFNADNTLNTDDIATQTTLCLSQIATILADEGLTKDNIVKLGIWLTDKNDFVEFNKAYAEFLGNHRPARSTVQSQLMLVGSKVEIEAIAAY
jgi:2-iminobutanoate/2-iminopropanoate deaminase